jgi:protein-S-isoprenylcysteine O-methyltransferase Ste14
MSIRHIAGVPQQAAGFSRALVLTYGSLVYVAFLFVFLYLIGFVGGFGVPVTIDSGGAAASTGSAIAINVGLLGLFAVQHTIMARHRFKKWWTRFVPEPMERSTFVLFTLAVLIAIVLEWRPMPTVVWQLESGLARGILWTTFALGWGIVLLATFLIDHFDLFGLKQVVIFARGREYPPPRFEERSLYRFVRHPLLLGFMIAFWSAPTMTQGHLLFAVVTTAYMLAAIRIEERGLIAVHGESYEDYRRRVSMLLPLPRRSSGGSQR